MPDKPLTEIRRPRIGVGRPSALTPEVRTKLILALKNGNHRLPSARYAGVHPSTFMAWLAKGRVQRSGQYREFLDEVEAAEAEVEIRVMRQWQGHMPKSWEAARAYLAARHPERWSQRVIVTVTNELTSVIDRLTEVFADRPEILEEALNAIAAGTGGGAPRLVEGEATRGFGGAGAGGDEAVQPAPPESQAGDVSPD